MIESTVLLTGVLVFFARICDVAIGTVRTIVTVQGRTLLAFCLAVFEIVIWLLVASTVISQVKDQPILVIFYALGYATGNVVGIKVEKKLAFGSIILKVICRESADMITKTIRDLGQPVTKFVGEGINGPVNELYIVCRRRDLRRILSEIEKIDNQVFYVVEQANSMNRILRPVNTPIGGWRSRSNRK
ncbi:DUF5698 domain-containing protein [uncultured Desulfobacter sp.]|uniref:DUF2179 domain-containing protein n=1 Tax=uncultured Desulfobacter sp. TaxID=240139 RepID=UPI0029C67ECA|nr:DUF5698 domain-containing protein [uncultured Desulfobacter sp.]